MHTHSLSHTYIHLHTLSLSQIHTFAYTLSLARAHTRAHKHVRTHNTHTQHTRAHTQHVQNTHTHTHTRQVRSSEAAADDGPDADTLGSCTATVPIFICSLGLPAVRCQLHVFEPRYRLMMRRCLDSGRHEFGMLLGPSVGFGTMLLIEEFTQLPDGRSRVSTIGQRRFKVLEMGNKDGYSTAKVEWLDDLPLSASERLRAAELGLKIRQRLEVMLAPLRARSDGTLGRLEEQIGPMPEDDSLLPFWASVLLGQNNMQLQLGIAFGEATRRSPLARLEFLSSLLATATPGAAPRRAINDDDDDE
ncbi:PUA-like domain-containing protein [Pavlovales sp. CCMP2436]|nr:PUA-like domain-containing protein [Pavlovales sp. CCMP2436]